METSNQNRNSTNWSNENKEKNDHQNQLQDGSSLATSSAAAQSFINPYQGHRALTPVEQDLLGEYARLAATIKRVSIMSTSRCFLSHSSHFPISI